MAAEFIRIGRVTRCREVNRSIDANGNVVETWGAYLPLSYCSHDGRQQTTYRRESKNPTDGSTLGDFNYVDGFEKPNFEPPVTDDRSLSSESKFLLIAAAVGFALLGLVFVFKK